MESTLTPKPSSAPAEVTQRGLTHADAQSLPLDEWSTIVVQKRRRRAYLYINEQREDRIRMRRPVGATEVGLTIGAGYEGEVDQVRISGGQMRTREKAEASHRRKRLRKLHAIGVFANDLPKCFGPKLAL